MKTMINEDQILDLANQHGLSSWPLEEDAINGNAFYVDRDIADTSLYNMARVTFPNGDGAIKVFCGLYNAKGQVAADKVKEYENIVCAFEDIKTRFDHLRAPYQPRKLAEKKSPPKNNARYIH